MTRHFSIPEELPFCSKPRRMRIADILLQDQDCAGGGSVSMDGEKGRMGGGCVFGEHYWSPRRIIRRWLKRLREKKVGVELGCGSMPTRCSTNCPTGGGVKESNDWSEPSSGTCTKENSFSIGVGFSLLYLIANSKNELNKMSELRTQMENFLQLAKDNLQRKDEIFKLSETLDDVTYSTTDIPEGSNSNTNFSVQSSAISYAIPESEATLECDRSCGHDSPKLEYYAEGINHLEQELEAELERLQLHLETETSLEHPQLERIEVNVRENNDPIEIESSSCGEVIDPQDDSTEEYYDGVPPYVLERRLHELLEARQEEHIQELEAALKCFQHKLHEKEQEIKWWKDTARLISQRIPGASRLT